MQNENRTISLVKQLGDFSSGITDGLTISLAVAAGLWYGGFSTALIAAACLSVSFTVGLVMATGCFFSRRGQMLETPEHTLKEWNRTRSMMESLGLSAEQLTEAENVWLKDRSEMTDEDKYTVPFSRIFLIGSSFLVGGLVPALCFYLSGESGEALRIAVVVSGICFITFGFLRDKVNGLRPWWGALRALLIGAVAVLVSIGLARLFT